MLGVFFVCFQCVYNFVLSILVKENLFIRHQRPLTDIYQDKVVQKINPCDSFCMSVIIGIFTLGTYESALKSH